MSQSFWSPQHLSIKLRGPDVDFQQTVQQPYAFLGSHADCDIVVDDPELGPRSLFFVITNKGVRVIVLSANAKKSGRLLKVDADRPFKLRNYELIVRAVPHNAAEDETTEPADDSVFVVTWKHRSCRQFLQLAHQIPILFGRKWPSNLFVENEQLSGVHGCLFRSGEQLFVFDLSSTNGTWIGIESVRCSPIQLGKSFRAGDQYFHFLRLYPNVTFATHPNDNKKLIVQLEHATTMCAHLDRELGALNSQIETHRLALLAMHELQATWATALLLADARQSTIESQLKSELSATRDELAEKQRTLDDLLPQHDTLRQANEQQEESQRQLESQLTDAKTAYDELVNRIVSEDDGLAERAKLLEAAGAELRQREEELDKLRRELLVESNVLRTLHQEIAIPESAADRPAEEDETCISSLDFHELLEEALESLPVIDDNRDSS